MKNKHIKHIRKHLEKLRKIERHKYHPLIHTIHKKHKISKKTLFYVKEYGHKKVVKTIIKESIKILLLASIISSFGGFALENIKSIFISIMPLIILFPALNDMIGDYGTIISSRFSAMLHEGIIRKDIFRNKELKKLFMQVFIVAIITAILSSVISFLISILSDYNLDMLISLKILAIAIIDSALLVGILFLISVYAGLYYFKKKEDPNNFLIPISTSIADFGNMIILSILVILFF